MIIKQATLLLILFGFTCIHASIGFSLDVPRIDFNIDSPLHAEYQQQLLDLRMAEIKLYDKHTKDPKPSRAAAKRFLNAAAFQCVPPPTTLKREAGVQGGDLPSLAKKAFELGSTDPLVRRYHARLVTRSRDEVDLAFKDFESSSYPKHFRVEYQAAQLEVLAKSIVYGLRYGQIRKDRTAMKDQLRKFRRALPAYVKWMSMRPNFQRPCVAKIKQICSFDFGDIDRKSSQQLDTASRGFLKYFIQDYRASKHRDPWVLEIVQGYNHHLLAWDARGTGFASTVDKTSLETFKKEREIAARHYKEAHRLSPDRPEAAAEMVGIIGSGYDDAETSWTWFQRSIEAELDYPQAYNNVCSFLKPKWGGSLEASEDFATQCADSKLYGTQVPLVYLQWVFNSGDRGGLSETIRTNPSIYWTVKELVNGLLKDPAWQSLAENEMDKKAGSTHEMNESQIRFCCQLLICAIQADEHKDTLELFTKIENHPSLARVQDLFSAAQLVPEYEKSRCAAYAQFYEELISIQPLTSERHAGVELSEEIYRVYSDLLSRCRPEATRYLQTWKQITALEIQFHQGQWVHIPFDKDVNTFQIIGNWKFLDANTAVGDSRKGKILLQIVSKCVFPDPIEIAMDVSSDDPLHMKIGIERGDPTENNRDRYKYGSKLQGRFAYKMSDNVGSSFITMPTPKQLSLTSWGPERTEFRVNGNLLPGTKSPGLNKTATLVGVTNVFLFPSRGQVTIKNLRVRKISKAMPPAEVDFNACVTYYTKAIEANPNHSDYFYFRGLSQFNLKRYSEALSDLNHAISKDMSPMFACQAKYVAGIIHRVKGDQKQSEKRMMEVFDFSSTSGHRGVTAVAHLAMTELIEMLVDSAEPTPQEIKHVGALADKFVKKFPYCQAHTVKAVAQIFANNLQGAKASLATAKSKALTDDQHEKIKNLQTKLEQLNKPKKFDEPKP